MTSSHISAFKLSDGVLALAAAFILTSPQTSLQLPLISTIRGGDVIATETLLKLGADPNTHAFDITKPSYSEGRAGGERSQGLCALAEAAQRRSPQFVKLLLKYRGDPNLDAGQPLFTAVHYGPVELVQALIDAGADPRRVTNGRSVLDEVARTDQVATVKVLLKSGASLNDGSATSPLFEAASGYSPAMVKLLLAKGADPNERRGHAWSPTEEAVRYDRDDLVKLMVRAGGKPRPSKIILELVARSYGDFDPDPVLIRAKTVPFEFTATDLKVIETAVSTYVDHGEQIGRSPQPIHTINIFRRLSGSYLEQWLNYDLTAEQALSLDLAMRENWLGRNDSDHELPDLTFNDTRIHIIETPKKRSYLDRYKPKPPGTATYSVCLPGYSSDGTRALLQANFSWSIHGATATFLLEKRSDHWRVVWTRVKYSV